MTARAAAPPAHPPADPLASPPADPPAHPPADPLASPPADPPAPSTRDRIVDAALRLFSERGTSAVSVREVADAAGVTVPGLYYHFASKADLIREVYRANGVRPGWDPETDFVPPTARKLVDRIIEQAQHEFSRMQANEEFLRHMQREDTLGDDDARAVGVSLSDAWRVRWSEVILASEDLAPDADVEVAADVIATFLWGLFVMYLSRRDESVVRSIEPFARIIGAALTRRD